MRSPWSIWMAKKDHDGGLKPVQSDVIDLPDGSAVLMIHPDQTTEFESLIRGYEGKNQKRVSKWLSAAFGETEVTLNRAPARGEWVKLDDNLGNRTGPFIAPIVKHSCMVCHGRMDENGRIDFGGMTPEARISAAMWFGLGTADPGERILMAAENGVRRSPGNNFGQGFGRGVLQGNEAALTDPWGTVKLIVRFPWLLITDPEDAFIDEYVIPMREQYKEDGEWRFTGRMVGQSVGAGVVLGLYGGVLVTAVRFVGPVRAIGFLKNESNFGKKVTVREVIVTTENGVSSLAYQTCVNGRPVSYSPRTLPTPTETSSGFLPLTPRAIGWQAPKPFAEQAGIPNFIDLSKPNNFWGLDGQNLQSYFRRKGFDSKIVPPKPGTSGKAEVFNPENHLTIKEVEYHPGGGIHQGKRMKTPENSARFPISRPARIAVFYSFFAS